MKQPPAIKPASHTPLLLALILSVAGAPRLATAEDQPEAKPAEARTATNATSPLPSAARVVSAETAARISTALPKFSPPKPEQKPEDLPDLREIDKPRNGIIRLPEHIVRESKMPELKYSDLLTRTGKLDLLYKRHPGLRIGNNSKPAAFMLAEEERLERIAEANDLTGLMESPAKARALWKDSLPLFMRSNEWVDARFASWAEFHQR